MYDGRVGAAGRYRGETDAPVARLLRPEPLQHSGPRYLAHSSQLDVVLQVFHVLAQRHSVQHLWILFE